MFQTCFYPEDSLCLYKFCSSPSADVEAGVIVARMFFFSFICLSPFAYFKNPVHFIVFSIRDK